MANTHIHFIRRSSGAAAVAALLAACGGGSGDGAVPVACESITTETLKLPGIKVSSSTSVPEKSDGSATENYPAHCKVTGTLNERTGMDGKPYAIGYEVRMPKTWNGKFLYQGGEGTDGVLAPALGKLWNTDSNALRQGYAVVSSDGGHATGQADATFGLDPQARSDYGYNAVGSVTPAAKQIVKLAYGRAPERSYFLGCSNGGRGAMVAASRFADQFDGLVAGNPGYDLPKAAVQQIWDTQQFMQAAGSGQLPKDAFPQATMDFVGSRILAKCDALDGAEDGIVQNRTACQAAFDFARDVPACTGGATSNCLPTVQKNALQKVFDGVKNSVGQSLYTNFPWDPGVAGENWRFWKLEAAPIAPLPFNTLIGAGAVGYIFTSPPDAPSLADAGLGYQLRFSMDTDAPKIFGRSNVFKESALEFMNPPDPQLAALKSRAGKLIVYHGTADPVFSAHRSVEWYQALASSDANAGSYARLFLVPGMNHCSGGPATDRFNMLAALERWVEQGQAPDKIIASVNPADPDVRLRNWPAKRTRPLCPYPQQATLIAGAQDLESADSFVCK